MELGDRDLARSGFVVPDLLKVVAAVESSAPVVVAKVARCSFAGLLQVAVAAAAEVGQMHGSFAQIGRPY